MNRLSCPLSEYELIEEVGRGSTGVFYKARAVRLDRVVTLKVALPNWATDPRVQDEFIFESRILANLSERRTPNIPSLYEVSQQGGWLYQVREFVDGSTLQRVAADGLVDFDEAIEVLTDIAKTIRAVHAAGFVHRNLSLSNVLIAGERMPKLIGFGSLDVLAGSNWKGLNSPGSPLSDDLRGFGKTLTDLSAISNRPLSDRLAAICKRCLTAGTSEGYTNAATLVDELSGC
jgi:serine/threonine protein kinase